MEVLGGKVRPRVVRRDVKPQSPPKKLVPIRKRTLKKNLPNFLRKHKTQIYAAGLSLIAALGGAVSAIHVVKEKMDGDHPPATDSTIEADQNLSDADYREISNNSARCFPYDSFLAMREGIIGQGVPLAEAAGNAELRDAFTYQCLLGNLDDINGKKEKHDEINVSVGGQDYKARFSFNETFMRSGYSIGNMSLTIDGMPATNFSMLFETLLAFGMADGYLSYDSDRENGTVTGNTYTLPTNRVVCGFEGDRKSTTIHIRDGHLGGKRLRDKISSEALRATVEKIEMCELAKKAFGADSEWTHYWDVRGGNLTAGQETLLEFVANSTKASPVFDEQGFRVWAKGNLSGKSAKDSIETITDYIDERTSYKAAAVGDPNRYACIEMSRDLARAINIGREYNKGLDGVYALVVDSGNYVKPGDDGAHAMVAVACPGKEGKLRLGFAEQTWLETANGTANRTAARDALDGEHYFSAPLEKFSVDSLQTVRAREADAIMGVLGNLGPDTNYGVYVNGLKLNYTGQELRNFVDELAAVSKSVDMKRDGALWFVPPEPDGKITRIAGY